jgi:enamine deaminase RidA (YjgF/YER057c/UK114 family)
MRKFLLGPGAGSVDSDDLDHPARSIGVATEHDDHTRISLSGVTSAADDLSAQARAVLRDIDATLGDAGGTFDDVVTARWHVEADSLDRDAEAAIHEASAEFFEAPHYPATTLVGVASVLGEGAVLELAVEAEVPGDDWEVDAFVGEDREEMSEDAAREMLVGEDE